MVFLIDSKDFDIEPRNKHLNYYILKRADVEVGRRNYYFFHGLNEKKGTNICLWAYELAQN